MVRVVALVGTPWNPAAPRERHATPREVLSLDERRHALLFTVENPPAACLRAA